jgi:hypothetical protein
MLPPPPPPNADKGNGRPVHKMVDVPPMNPLPDVTLPDAAPAIVAVKLTPTAGALIPSSLSTNAPAPPPAYVAENDPAPPPPPSFPFKNR